MADRYATNAFLNFQQYEEGVFGKSTKSQTVLSGDNPDFLYPGKSLRNSIAGTTQPMRRGYMRMLSQGFEGGTSLSRKRLHFQFNPDILVRSVTARNDIQQWMNMDPIQMTQPIPGDSNFSFKLFFNREPEVASGSYQTAGGVKTSTERANLPLQGAGAKNKPQSVNIPHSAVTDLGVLADLMVFDEIIGQGINTNLIDKMIKNAQGVSAAKQNAYYKTQESTDPGKPAQAKVKTVNGSGGITAIELVSGGEGYKIPPDITIKSKNTNASGASLKATVSNGKVTEVLVQTAGTNYKVGDGLTFQGGGQTTSSSSSSTSDAQDQPPPEFDAAEAKAALYNNYGNSAFLVSLPVRIVFSSLFMVEGFITSTIVTFNKFNASMVPTMCTVDVTMQAMYIGFARKDTFLTTTLETAVKDAKKAITELAGTTETATSENKLITAAGEKMFFRIQQWGGNGISWGIPRFQEHFSSHFHVKQLYDAQSFTDAGKDYSTKGDGKVDIGFQLDPTDSFEELCKKSRVTGVTAVARWSAVYRGNTNPSTLASYLATPQSFAVDEVLFELESSTNLNVGDLGSGGDSAHFPFIFDDEAFFKTPDKSDTSLYDVSFTVTFQIKSTNANKPVSQYLEAKQTGRSYNDKYKVRDSYVFIPAAKRND